VTDDAIFDANAEGYVWCYERRFGHRRITDRYLEVYETIRLGPR